MTELRFRSPSGNGVAVVPVLSHGPVEYAEVDMTILRELLTDLGFTEEVSDQPLPPGSTYIGPETSALIECRHWEPGSITMRRGCTACAADPTPKEA